MTWLNKTGDTSFFFSYILVPLFLLDIYFISFEFLLTPLFDIPGGVNFVFADISWKYLSVLLIGCLLVFIILVFNKKGDLIVKRPDDKLTRKEIILLLLPLTPIVQYIIVNQEILSLTGVLRVVIFFVLFSSIYIYLVPWIFHRFSSIRMLSVWGLAFVYSIVSMASLSRQFSWIYSGNLAIQWLMLVGIFAMTWVFYHLNTANLFYILIIVMFTTNTVMQLNAYPDWKDRTSGVVTDNKLLSLVGDRLPANTPNIYLLIYDAYVPNETMLAYGIDNRPQEEYLIAHNFELYPHTYSVANFSLGSMSRVLNISTDYYGNPRRSVSGDGVVQNLLKDFGYTTYGIFRDDYFFLNIDSSYDDSIQKRSSTPEFVWRSILMGEFRFDVGYNELPREEYVEAKRRVFEIPSDEPKFLYTHSLLPGHSQNSGVCRADEIDRFEKDLLTANDEMRQDIETILEHDPGAIIIIAGDHGPYLTKNCTKLERDYSASEITRLDIQDRFGTFLAIRWPTDEYSAYDDITVLQDIFPAIFAYLFKDEQLLESKIEPTTLYSFVTVKDGILIGGVNDGEPLFIGDN
jgi:hypothetical protein